MQNLSRLLQEDFSAGMQRDVAPHLIDTRAVYDLVNGLIDDDGSIYKRGGSVAKSNANMTGTRVTSIYDAHFFPGRRTIFSTESTWAVLAANDATPNNVIGVTGATRPDPAQAPPAFMRGIAFLPYGTMYAGAQSSARVTGTATFTTSSTTVTTASGFSVLMPGSLIIPSGERAYSVKSMTNDTTIVLDEPYEGAGGALSYIADSLITPRAPYPGSSFIGGPWYVVCADRMVARDPLLAHRLIFSASGNPHSWPAANYHDLPDGVRIQSAATVGQTLILFTTAGVYTLRGLAYEIVDAAGNPQHRLEKLNSDIRLLGPGGIATWDNALVVPATDTVYLIDGNSPPRDIGRPIQRLYRDYVATGYRCGQAAFFRGHYLLPILSNSANTVIDVLVCRLDRPVRSRGLATFPWTRLEGAGKCGVYCVRSTDPVPLPVLLGGFGGSLPTRLIDCTAFFNPAAAVKKDYDATDFDLTLTTRDFTLFGEKESTLKRVLARYVLLDAASDNPVMALDWSDGGTGLSAADVWGTMLWGTGHWSSGGVDGATFTSLTAFGPESDGADPYTWHLGKRMRFARLRLRSSGPSAKLALRSLELVARNPRTART